MQIKSLKTLEDVETLFQNNEEYEIRNLDLSNIDLSSLPIYEYNIINSNLSNTGLKILINKGSYRSNLYFDSNLRGCKFIEGTEPSENTDIIFKNVLLDEEQIKFLNNLNNPEIRIIYDYNTLLKNENIVVDSESLLEIIKEYLRINNILNKIIPLESITEIVKNIEKLITKDKNGNLSKFYNSIKEQLTPYEIINMFYFRLKDVTIKDLLIDKEMYEIFRKFYIINAKLENVTFLSTTKDISNSEMNFHNGAFHKYSQITDVSFPNLSMEDYKDINNNFRISSTPFTFKKNLYLELGRKCNAKCFFCRNECFKEQNYKFDYILNQLRNIYNQLDSIVIGGGEPTLKRKDLFELLNNFNQDKFYLFSNGTMNDKFLDFLNKKGTKLYISRHHFDDEENAKIFRINKNKIITQEDYKYLYNDITLACTCFKGGIDSVYKIFKYLEYAQERIGTNVLFCNLQNDASVNESNSLDRSLEIDENLFEECIELLKNQGYEMKYPIVSTGGYILYILKHPIYHVKTISFKKYISKEELLRLWPTAVKRTYDFSMTPNGDVYANWSETGEKVKSLKRI